MGGGGGDWFLHGGSLSLSLQLILNLMSRLCVSCLLLGFVLLLRWLSISWIVVSGREFKFLLVLGVVLLRKQDYVCDKVWRLFVIPSVLFYVAPFPF